ncbi:matrixin family metalloprotease [Paludibaculum fermentans]|uniref:Matrixin family metalloprotease n=1 Tax=Paludibaculum fermentans TaxID=1473598 RepID=A0A7S7SMG1_PALFE|nr:matrixin family metalloprotease [Paludibaculum fermentans]QOY89451.1 matrixin family metalloprotease [Paludibaculum fermentans]
MRMRSWAAAAGLALIFGTLAPAYYHWVRFQAGGAPYTPVYAHYDLNALQNKTVPFFISDNGPTQMASGDSFAAVISQIRSAAAVWNGVGTSDIKLSFGGLFTAGTQMNAPGIQVQFSDEIPPGMIAYGVPTIANDAVQSPNGPFYPITGAVLMLRKSMSADRPSWAESFFLPVVHEFGHTLGLQHTWTSSVMSTEVTRTTTKSKPLGLDDIAGISVLYPNDKFKATTGVITGRVSMGGAGVNLASVVALAPNRQAISALTYPDGTYRIEGVPAGTYYVYAHSLPPAVQGEIQPVNVILPTDPSGSLMPVGAFDLAFAPGTSNPQQPYQVAAGQSTDGVNVAVNPRPSVTLFGVQTYSYFYYGENNSKYTAVKPATLLLGKTIGRTVLAGNGLPMNGVGLTVSSINGFETVTTSPYTSQFLIADLRLNPASSEGPRHLRFDYNGESYILPSGVQFMQQLPPAIQSVTQNADRTLTLTGANLGASTTVWVDGVSAKIVSAQDGKLVIAPPPAQAGYRAVLAAFNPDGQSSLFIYGVDSPAYVYDTPALAQINVAPTAVPAGTETIVEINGVNTSFDNWLPSLGIGSSDVTVRQVYTMNGTKAVATITISPQATAGPAALTVSSGLLLSNVTGGFQILPNSKPLYVAASAMTGGIYSGGQAVLPMVNLANARPTTVTAVLTDRTGNDRIAQAYVTPNNTITVQIPDGFPLGPAIVKLVVDGVSALPTVVQVDQQPPSILAVQSILGTMVAASAGAHPGDTLQLLVLNLGDGVSAIDPSRITVTSPGIADHSVQSVIVNPAVLGSYLVQFSLSTSTPVSSSLPLVVSIDGRTSPAFYVTVSK